jgi:hypothetical protein
VAALALTGRDAEASEALKRYLALPSTGPLKTVAAFQAYYSSQGGGPARVELNERTYDRAAQSGDAGGVSDRYSVGRGLDARQGVPLRG